MTIMGRLSGAWKRDAYEKVQRFCKLRLQGELSEDKIAKELGFRSPEVMHMQLKRWGLSGPLVDDGRTGGAGKRQRKASTSGGVKELPAAGQVERLFRADFKRLTYYLDQIPDLREHLQGQLYASISWVGEDWEEYYRDEYTEEGWKAICQDFGEDPAQEAFRVPISPYIHHGAGPEPWEGLALLIAMHALMHERVDRLVSALHPDPASVNLAELHKRKGRDDATQDGMVAELKRAARKLAVIVRGGQVKTGQKSGVVAPEEIQIALMVVRLTKEGLSAEEIYHRLKECRLLDEQGRYWVRPEHEEFVRKEKYTSDDLKRHQKLDLSPPD